VAHPPTRQCEGANRPYPADVQRARVTARPGWTDARLDAILAQQLPDAEKRARADFVIDTGEGLQAARDQVRQVMATLRAPGWAPKAKSGHPAA